MIFLFEVSKVRRKMTESVEKSMHEHYDHMYLFGDEEFSKLSIHAFIASKNSMGRVLEPTIAILTSAST